MKKIIKIAVCFLILIGCTDDNNLLEDIAVRGGYIQFEDVPDLNLKYIRS